MIYSMTGFGRAADVFEGKKITLEIKALNSKQLDISLKCPSYYRVKEMQIRNAVAKSLKRGKIDVNIYAESLGLESKASINEELVKSYAHDLKKLMADIDLSNDSQSNLLEVIFKMPDVLKTEKDEMRDAEWGFLKGLLDQVLEGVNGFRADEGLSLNNDLQGRIDSISRLLDEIKGQDGIRQEKVQKRIKKSLEAVRLTTDYDMNRFEQEMIYYIEKMDISEEKTRLDTHCKYFSETMREGEQGRKLNFISQEIGREINTISSKANDAEIQKKVVLMKDELEKIKEQCANVL